MNDFLFPVELTWPGDKHVIATVTGKPEIEIATPPEFKGAFPEAWSVTRMRTARSCIG